jgi:hypothetical protein
LTAANSRSAQPDLQVQIAGAAAAQLFFCERIRPAALKQGAGKKRYGMVFGSIERNVGYPDFQRELIGECLQILLKKG